MRKNLTIGIAGAGGDGVVAMGRFLQKIAACQGYFSQMPRYYGAQIRGGGSAVKLGLDAESLSLPRDTVHIMLCFNWKKYLEVNHELQLGKDTVVLYDIDPPAAMDLPAFALRIGFTDKALLATRKVRNKNLVALGLLLRILGIAEKRTRQAIEGDMELRLLKENLAALEAGEQLFSEFSFPDLRLCPAKDESAKIVLHGNTAVGRAAIRAGCRAFFGYPITPSAEVMQEIQKGLPRAAGVFLQAEDEIAASGMVVGASLAAGKAMTATSGPGLDLMTEMMGLAIAAEIPLVIIDVQRCGPSTGIPSKSEQSDLNHAIYGGHGDAPRVVMAPYDVEGCYRLVHESFDIAEHFQTVVVLLSDQWLGQTFVATNGAFLEREYHSVSRKKPGTEDLKGYHRYRFTDDHISPMSDVGDRGLMYRTSGLSHNVDGAPAFDFETHQRLHQKRWKKLMPLCQRDDLINVFGNEASTKGVITWGSSAQIVLDTIKFLGLENTLKICVPELLCPQAVKIDRFVRSVDRLLVVEMNYSGQLYHYLRSQIDLPKETRVYCRAGGRPFSRRELAEPIGEIAK